MNAPMRPMSWNMGNQLQPTSPSVMPVALVIAAVFARMLAWLSTTPLGLSMVPEVY